MHAPRCEGHSVHREYGESKCREKQSALKVTYVVESYSGKVITALGLCVCVFLHTCMFVCPPCKYNNAAIFQQYTRVE